MDSGGTGKVPEQNQDLFINNSFSNLKVGKGNQLKKLDLIGSIIHKMKMFLDKTYKNNQITGSKKIVNDILTNLKDPGGEVDKGKLIYRLGSVSQKVFDRSKLATDRSLVNDLSDDIQTQRREKLNTYITQDNWKNELRDGLIERGMSEDYADYFLLGGQLLDKLGAIFPQEESIVRKDDESNYDNSDLNEILKMNLNDEDRKIINSHIVGVGDEIIDLEGLSDEGKNKIQAFYHRNFMEKLDNLPLTNIYTNDTDDQFLVT